MVVWEYEGAVISVSMSCHDFRLSLCNQTEPLELELLWNSSHSTDTR